MSKHREVDEQAVDEQAVDEQAVDEQAVEEQAARGDGFWRRTVENLRASVPRARFDTWLSRLACASYDDKHIDLISPNAFTKDWIQRHYAALIQTASAQVDGRSRSVRIHDGPAPGQQAGSGDEKDKPTLLGEFVQVSASPQHSLQGACSPAEARGFQGTVEQPVLSASKGAELDEKVELTTLLEPSLPEERPATSGVTMPEAAMPEAAMPEAAMPEAAMPGETVQTASGLPFWESAAQKQSEPVAQSGGAAHSQRSTGADLPMYPPCDPGRPVPGSGAPGSGAPGSGAGAASYNQSSLSFFHDHSETVLNDAFTFQNFVVGSRSELSYAAAKAVVEFPGGPYNPFFIHGSSGLGKTHLLQAICHAVLRSSTPRRVLYLTCETFVNQFIQAVTNGDLESFRYKYRKVDILLIDDIQFLEGKTRTQEEFFHTFNTLYNAQRQIVLSSDRPPKEIATLQDRLVSRMRWGMVTKVETPCLETRIAIVKRKARLRGTELPDDVCQCLAEEIDTNVRELEGAVTKVIGFSSLMGKRIDLELVREALRDLLPSRSHVNIQDIIEVVCKDFGVMARELQSKRRIKSLVLPRQICIYLARRHTPLSLGEIGGFFGGRDHSTVLHSVRKIERCCEESPELRLRITELSSLLLRGGGRRR